ncbi:L-amino acid oxidase [Coprinopsis sp. MPI-PUGE-AT-0042]|nr:L-amino acid oxidase [Coprinopsis sp. MPI-PUGE-AT-0042]
MGLAARNTGFRPERTFNSRISPGRSLCCAPLAINFHPELTRDLALTTSDIDPLAAGPFLLLWHCTSRASWTTVHTLDPAIVARTQVPAAGIMDVSRFGWCEVLTTMHASGIRGAKNLGKALDKHVASQILSSTGSSIRIEVPPGWHANLSAISRKTYNQLVQVDVEVNGETLSNYLVNMWGQTNQPMRDLDSHTDTVSIKPVDKTFVIAIHSYFSTVAKIKEDDLLKDEYRSSQVNTLSTQRHPKAPAGFPDYSTSCCLLRIALLSKELRGVPEFDDSLVTLNITQGPIPGSLPDTSSAALAQTGKDAPGPTVDPMTLVPNKPYPVSPYPVGIIVGAMRFPDTTFMARTFKLKDRLGIKMLDYIRSNDNSFMCFNESAPPGLKPSKEGGHLQGHGGQRGQIPEDEYQKGPEYFRDVILDELRQYFVKYPFQEAFEKLKQWEGHSVRSYLLVVKKIPYPVRLPAGTNVPWYCFDGGSEVLHKAVQERLTTKPQLYMRATDIHEADGGASIEVEFDSRANPRPFAQGRTKKKFSNVISTMSFACLRMVNLDHLTLSYAQKSAIRTLMYTPSIKIGMQFKTAWWEKKCNIFGGQSSTDRPIRNMLYPSYGPDGSHPGSQKSNCMIVAYSGMQDSQRLGGLMKGRGTPEEKTMLDLVMRDLAAVHKIDVKELWDEFEDYFPWDFYRDEFQLGSNIRALGAFCQFSPGQFEHVYPHVCQPGSKQQRFYFAGDACSTFHGWVAGALNSAWRSVFQMLMAHPELNPNPGEDIIAKFKAEWGDSEEWDQRDLEKVTQLNAKLAESPATRSGEMVCQHVYLTLDAEETRGLREGEHRAHHYLHQSHFPPE